MKRVLVDGVGYATEDVVDVEVEVEAPVPNDEGKTMEGGEVEEGRSCEVAEKRRDPRRGKSAVESPPERRTGGAVALVMVE